MIGYGQRQDLDGWVAEWAQRLADTIVEIEKKDDGIPDSIKPGGKHGYWYTADGLSKEQVFGANYQRLHKLKKNMTLTWSSTSGFPLLLQTKPKA